MGWKVTEERDGKMGQKGQGEEAAELRDMKFLLKAPWSVLERSGKKEGREQKGQKE